MNDISNDVTAVDVKGKGRADLPPTSAKAIAAATAERDASLRKMYVVVPAGDESKTIRCPICKEQLKTEFMEDNEEWVWRNAIMVKGKVRPFYRSPALPCNLMSNVNLPPKVYHATCHADALSSQTAARLRHQTARGSTPLSSRTQSRSRSGTPETASGLVVKTSGSPLRRGQTITPPPSATAASNGNGLKRKSPSRNDESGTPAICSPALNGNFAEVKAESEAEDDQSQPNKRARTSPPPLPTSTLSEGLP